MELHRYLQVLWARWYDVLLLMLIGLAGTFTYLQWNAGYKARTTVAVLEPTVAKALSGQAATVTFAAVAQSYQVADRVVRRLGLNLDPGRLQSKIDVKLSRSLVPNVATPLYTVTVEGKDEPTALALANAVVDESRALFTEMNTLRPEEVAVTLSGMEKDLQARITDARKVLHQFEDDNKAWRLPALIEGQTALVSSLTQAAAANQDSAAAVGQYRSALAGSVGAANSELSRLQSLKTQHDDLAFRVGLGSSTVAQLTARMNDATLAGDQGARDAVVAQLAGEQRNLEAARQQLTGFERQNGVVNVDAEVNSQMALINELRRQQTTAITPSGSVQQRAQTERAELDRLVALRPDYERLAADVDRAGAELGQFTARRLDMMVSGAVSPTAFIKPLDAAQIQSSFLLDIIFYTLGAVAGFVAGLLLIYVIAYFDRVPRTTEEVHDLLGVPVFGRVPSVSSR